MLGRMREIWRELIQACLDCGGIIRVVCRSEQTAIGFQGASRCVQKARIKHPAPMVPTLRPGIGEEEMKYIDRAGREGMLDCVQHVGFQNARVSHFLIANLATGSTDTAEQLLNSEEITVRMALRECHQEGAVAAAEVDLKRRFSAKHLA